MDQKVLRSYDKEFMKMAMLKHEEIFREQVYELHRLYRIQKLLMNSTENGSIIRQKRDIADLNGDGSGLIEESEIELTLGPSVYKTNHDHHRKSSSSGQSLSSSNSTGSSQSPNPNAPTREDFAWEFTRSSQNETQMNLGEERLRQDRMKQQPPWLFQAVSLKLS